MLIVDSLLLIWVRVALLLLSIAVEAAMIKSERIADQAAWHLNDTIARVLVSSFSLYQFARIHAASQFEWLFFGSLLIIDLAVYWLFFDRGVQLKRGLHPFALGSTSNFDIFWAALAQRARIPQTLFMRTVKLCTLGVSVLISFCLYLVIYRQFALFPMVFLSTVGIVLAAFLTGIARIVLSPIKSLNPLK